MMILGVTISMRLSVRRPIPMLRKRRLISGVLASTGTPYSSRCSRIRFTPPRSTVPPSGTVTVVFKVVVVVRGSWIVR